MSEFLRDEANALASASPEFWSVLGQWYMINAGLVVFMCASMIALTWAR